MSEAQFYKVEQHCPEQIHGVTCPDYLETIYFLMLKSPPQAR